MHDHKPYPGQQNFAGSHVISNRSTKDGSAADSENPAINRISAPFQLVADFVVEAEEAAAFLDDPDIDPEERRLFLAIINTPEALNRICRLAITCDLTGDSEKYFKGRFTGPDPEDILDSILSYLPGELQGYWTTLRGKDFDSFEFSMDRIFDPFRTSLRNTEIIDKTTGESIPLCPNKRLGITPSVVR